MASFDMLAYLYTNFPSLWRIYDNSCEVEGLVCLPRNGSLALNGLTPHTFEVGTLFRDNGIIAMPPPISTADVHAQRLSKTDRNSDRTER